MSTEAGRLKEQSLLRQYTGARPAEVVRVDGTPDGTVDHLYRTDGGPPPAGDPALCGAPLRTFGQGRRAALCAACAAVAGDAGR